MGSHKVVGSLHSTYCKSMAHMINQSGSDFQQDGYLYKPTSDITWTLTFLTSDRPQKTSLNKSRPFNIWQWCSGDTDGVVDWWWRPLFDIVCICGGFYEIWSHSYIYSSAFVMKLLTVASIEVEGNYLRQKSYYEAETPSLLSNFSIHDHVPLIIILITEASLS